MAGSWRFLAVRDVTTAMSVRRLFQLASRHCRRPANCSPASTPATFGRFIGRIHECRREPFFRPDRKSRSRRAEGLSRLTASSRPPAGLGLDWSEHGGKLERIGAKGARHIIENSNQWLSEIHASGEHPSPRTKTVPSAGYRARSTPAPCKSDACSALLRSLYQM
jgi:hypothetical protein